MRRPQVRRVGGVEDGLQGHRQQRPELTGHTRSRRCLGGPGWLLGQDGPSRPGDSLSLPEPLLRPEARSQVETSSPCLCLSLSVSLPASGPRGAAGSPSSDLTAPELALACPLPRAQLRGLHGDQVGATEGVLMKAKHPAQLFLARTTCQQGERGVSRVGAPRTPAERPGRTELWGSRGCSGHPPSGHPALPAELLQARVAGPRGHTRHGRLSAKAPPRGQAAGGDCRAGPHRHPRASGPGKGVVTRPCTHGSASWCPERDAQRTRSASGQQPPSLGPLPLAGLGKAWSVSRWLCGDPSPLWLPDSQLSASEPHSHPPPSEGFGEGRAAGVGWEVGGSGACWSCSCPESCSEGIRSALPERLGDSCGLRTLVPRLPFWL